MEENNLAPFVSQWMTIQPSLFDYLDDEIGELDDDQKSFVRICSMVLKEGDFFKYGWCGNGRPPASRLCIFKAFLLKALMNYPTTKILVSTLRHSPALRRLCGWESLSKLPDASTFSLAFADFAKDDLACKVNADFVKRALGRRGIFHVSHDSSAIEAREKGVRKPQSEKEKEVTQLSAQRTRTADENFSNLPTHCDWGCKRDSKGKKKTWRGYKLHVACADGDIPVGVFLSSANLHDAKVMIPMMQKVSGDFEYFYDLADAGYDAQEIREASASLSHVPIIDRNPRRGEANVDDVGGRAVGIVEATTRRYFARSGVERLFGHLHDSHGGKFVRVRGRAKVLLHLMFGLIVIAAEQIYSNGLLT